MPQLSLYLDDKTYEKVKNLSQSTEFSVSKWVRTLINDSLSNEWPEGFFELFGSIDDPSFQAQNNIPMSKESKRIEL